MISLEPSVAMLIVPGETYFLAKLVAKITIVMLVKAPLKSEIDTGAFFWVWQH